MTAEQKTVYIASRIFEAYATLEGMKAANSQHSDNQPYLEKDFKDVVEKFSIDHNMVISFFS